jgi:hypothetical protein
MATKGSAAGFAAKRPDHLHPEEMGTKGSAAGFTAKRPDHLQAEGRRWAPKGQQQVLQQRDQITYKLRAGDEHQSVSSRLCNK